MAIKINRLAELAFKHLINDLSETESIELNQIRQEPNKEKLFQELMDRNLMRIEVKRLQQAHAHVNTSWQKIEAAYPFQYKNTTWKKLAVAAALVLVAGGVTWYALRKPIRQVVTTVAPKPATKQLASNYPPSRKGVWKQAANLAVYLDDLKNGVVGYADKLPVTKNDSELVYPAARSNNLSLSDDTVQTLPGGYYRVTLSDGSKVVLNSSSSVSFPASGSKERQVSVDNGEAYFDVVKDAERPFFVKVPGLKIQVHGTRFNVQAYKEDEIVRTTLVEGKVTVTAGKQVLMLKPGEQAVLTKNKKLEKIREPSTVKKATAWRSGTFVFENDDLKTIIAQLCRNYDLDVEYRGTIPNKTFYGIFSRNDKVEMILGYLYERSGVICTIKEKKIIVQP